MFDDNLKLSIFQMSATNQLAHNLGKVEEFLKQSQDNRSDLAVFPENVLCRGSYDDIRQEGHSEEFYVDQLGQLSRNYCINAAWGGIPVTCSDGLFNVILVFGISGQLLASYKKIHLFQLDLGYKAVDEGSLYNSGSTPVKFDLGGWTVGLAICYDLRFPELFRVYAGADLILCPSDFTHYTGQAHWEVLLRARAVENQCFVAGVNQCGMNKRMNVKSYGHSMVVDPWGTCLTMAGIEETCLDCTLYRDTLSRVRSKLPALGAIKHKIRW